MNEQKLTFDQIVHQFNSTLQNALTFTIFVRDKNLQKEQINILTNQIDQIRSFKYQAIKRKEENIANLFFGFHNLLNSVKSCLNMLLELKEEKYNNAWNSFVDAEEYLKYAGLVKDKLFGLEEYHQRLLNIEKCYFPEWPVFNSVGIIESIGDCNICGKTYGDCDHLEGLLYFGIVCMRINKKIIRADHVAFVKKPKDKRCVITKISTKDGFMQDYMTLKKLDKKIQKNLADHEMQAECILMSTKELKIN